MGLDQPTTDLINQPSRAPSKHLGHRCGGFKHREACNHQRCDLKKKKNRHICDGLSDVREHHRYNRCVQTFVERGESVKREKHRFSQACLAERLYRRSPVDVPSTTHHTGIHHQSSIIDPVHQISNHRPPTNIRGSIVGSIVFDCIRVGIRLDSIGPDRIRLFSIVSDSNGVSTRSGLKRFN